VELLWGVLDLLDQVLDGPWTFSTWESREGAVRYPPRLVFFPKWPTSMTESRLDRIDLGQEAQSEDTWKVAQALVDCYTGGGREAITRLLKMGEVTNIGSVAGRIDQLLHLGGLGKIAPYARMAIPSAAEASVAPASTLPAAEADAAKAEMAEAAEAKAAEAEAEAAKADAEAARAEAEAAKADAEAAAEAAREEAAAAKAKAEVARAEAEAAKAAAPADLPPSSKHDLVARWQSFAMHGERPALFREISAFQLDRLISLFLDSAPPLDSFLFREIMSREWGTSGAERRRAARDRKRGRDEMSHRHYLAGWFATRGLQLAENEHIAATLVRLVLRPDDLRHTHARAWVDDCVAEPSTPPAVLREVLQISSRHFAETALAVRLYNSWRLIMVILAAVVITLAVMWW
jgi:hypothetical protein